MRMKRVVSILAAAVLVFGLTGCNAITIDGETENASGEMSGNGSIGFSVSTLNNPFFVTLSEGAKEKAKTEGEKLIVVDAGDDAAKQTSDIEDLISKNISVLIVNPVDSDAVAPAVKDAVSRGIKVISVDRGVNGVDVDAQKPDLMGETAVETAIQILQGETVEKTIPVEVELITKDTAK